MPPRKKQDLTERRAPEMLRSVDDYRGQAQAKQLLEAYLQRGRLAGTILLLGERGLGKTALAGLIARALVCEQNRPDAQGGGQRLWFCGSCYACSSIASGNQPEFVTVRPRGQDIHEEQWTESGVSDTAWLHPSTLSHRLYLIDDAQQLNAASGNQMLKILEEPPARSVFILTTDRPHALLPTIHSRSLKIRLSPMPVAELLAALDLDEPSATAADKQESARMAAGRYVDARWLLLNAEWRRAVKRLGMVLAGGGDVYGAAKVAIDFEMGQLWNKELADTGFDEAEAAKQIPTPRKNTLLRLALGLAYDRAAWWGLTQGPPRPGLLEALAELKARVSGNCDAELAQAAFSIRAGL